MRRAGFTLIEILVVIAILSLLTVLAVSAYNGNQNQRVRDGARVSQSAIIGAKDRALHAKTLRGFRIQRDPQDANIGTGFVYVAPVDHVVYERPSNPVWVEQLDTHNQAGDPTPDGVPDIARVHVQNNPGLDYLNSQAFLSSPTLLRYPKHTGAWRQWSNLVDRGGGEFTVDVTPSPTNVVGTTVLANDSDASVEFRMFNEVLPNVAPIALPSGVVIDLTRSSPAARGDIMYSPRGTITGTVAAGGPIYILLRDIRDVVDGTDPALKAATHRDRLIICLSPQTGHCQSYPVDETDADGDGNIDDLFRFAKLGSAAGG